jgi:hypothetical protein
MEKGGSVTKWAGHETPFLQKPGNPPLQKASRDFLKGCPTGPRQTATLDDET